ncbi:MAG TPA: hypothetical protein P5555_07370 [Candidatus Paceibacterota bacterium]|nr:hypothetical protein [Candidatus Paceibacterota bacterium]
MAILERGQAHLQTQLPIIDPVMEPRPANPGLIGAGPEMDGRIFQFAGEAAGIQPGKRALQDDFSGACQTDLHLKSFGPWHGGKADSDVEMAAMGFLLDLEAAVQDELAVSLIPDLIDQGRSPTAEPGPTQLRMHHDLPGPDQKLR